MLPGARLENVRVEKQALGRQMPLQPSVVKETGLLKKRTAIVRPHDVTVLDQERAHKKQRTAKTLLIDNYDSYTYNLYQLISKVTGDTPTVIRNDELSWRALAKRLSRGQYQSVVISPGPGTPQKPHDIGVCQNLLEEAEGTPILGVCLGMQALAYAHGGQVMQASEPIHGRLSEVCHNNNSLFHGIPSGPGRGFEVVRYHSLAVMEGSLPACLEPIAWTCGKHHAVSLSREPRRVAHGLLNGTSGDNGAHDSVLMGIAHCNRPHWGVQFHPESVATTYGEALLGNFFSGVRDFHGIQAGVAANNGSTWFQLGSSQVDAQQEDQTLPQSSRIEALEHDNLDVRWRVLRNAAQEFGGSEAMFWHLYGSNHATNTFWLDSAFKDGQRFSYMGGQGGPLWRRLSFKLAHLPDDTPQIQPGILTITDAAGEQQTLETHFLDFLEAQVQQRRCCTSPGELPFDFIGGFVGYLGYEMKAECGARSCYTSPDPDAAMFFADRLVVVDHLTNDVFLVAIHERGNEASSWAEAWLEHSASCLHDLRANGMQSKSLVTLAVSKSNGESEPGKETPHAFTWQHSGDKWEVVDQSSGKLESRKSREAYLADVQSCLDSLTMGDSYELCLTTQLRRRVKISPIELYSRLRATNPAAHAAWLSFGAEMPTICCSSPERFLKGFANGIVEAKPIKGTARRYASPELDAESKAALVGSAKARAENLMIVDLLRNDLGRICQVGSVHVPGLMEVESYSTVHNLVSTVRGVRKKRSTVVDCLRACFPGGSMTGAPKRRSMEILDRLENGPRGVYSGCLGFIGLNNTFDLNIVIRTAVVSKEEVTIGAGGAIVLQSDPEEEYEEMLLKANALISAIDRCQPKP